MNEKEMKAREYQQNIFLKAIKKNSLVVLPTGLGKTFIAYLLAKYRLNQHKNTKALILAPTKPLVEQHLETFSSLGEVNILNGSIKKEKREKIWNESDVICATPQTIENDIINGQYDFKRVSLIVFDEAHRAKGKYSYTFLSKEYLKEAVYPRVLALTASPGSKRDDIVEILDNLGIEHIEYRTQNHPDVKKYTHERDLKYKNVELPEKFKIIQSKIKSFLNKKEKQISQFDGFAGFRLTRRNLLNAQKKVRALISQGESKDYFKLISILAQCMKIEHAQNLLETQGLDQFEEFMNNLKFDDTTKAAKNIFKDEDILKAYEIMNELLEKDIVHPKYDKIKEIVENNKDKKMIIFTQYRNSAYRVKDLIGDKLRAEVFIGQSKKRGKGLKQKEQIQMVEDFRNDKIDVLISTSVGEEGLDIPSVGLVVFYEPVPSGIRAIQRKGRTARHDKGKIIVLVTKGTRDEAYRWSSHHKEKKMYKILKELKTDIVKDYNKKKHKTLDSFEFQNNSSDDEEVIMYVDSREKNSSILRNLKKRKVNIKRVQMDIGDYQLSERCVVEYKSREDFINSLVDGRLLKQLKSMKSYKKPIIIVEGTEDIYSIRKVHQNAIRGLISTITVDFEIPLIYTKNSVDTSGYLYMIAKREQKKLGKKFMPHTEKKTGSLFSEIRYVVSSLPGIGPTLAIPLLKKFRTIKNLVNSTQKDLEMVELIGKKRTKRLQEVFNTDFFKDYDSSYKESGD
ncbi:MAG: DEAD/DEAH box helicase [Candidatus Woesearchaeota archaeon]